MYGSYPHFTDEETEAPSGLVTSLVFIYIKEWSQAESQSELMVNAHTGSPAVLGRNSPSVCVCVQLKTALGI